MKGPSKDPDCPGCDVGYLREGEDLCWWCKPKENQSDTPKNVNNTIDAYGD